MINDLTIVDVGASEGISPRWKNLNIPFKSILFEPDPVEFLKLKKEANKNLIVLNTALSDEAREGDLNVCRKQHLSSIFTPNIEFLNNFEDVQRFDVVDKLTVSMDTLDNQLAAYDIDFIKIDVQGYELQVLKGGTQHINNIVGIEIEVEFEPIYKNQPLFNNVNDFLLNNGFKLFDLKRYFWKRKTMMNTGSQKGQLVFGDALYFRAPESILLMEDVNNKKIINSFFVYLAYNYTDLAEVLLFKAFKANLLNKDEFNKLTLVLKKKYRRNFFARSFVTGYILNLLKRVARRLDNGYYAGTDLELGD